MVMSDEKITWLFRIRKTVMQMLRDRGYATAMFSTHNGKSYLAHSEGTVLKVLTFGDFDFEGNMSKHSKYGENMKREDLFIIKELRSNPSEKIYVFFPEEAKVGVKTCTNSMKDDDVHRAILVVQHNLTHFCSDLCE